jgi:hypothetical protein
MSKIKWPLIVAGLLAGWLIFGFAIPYWYAGALDGATLQKSGQLGDGFNAVSTLFAGAALCGTIYALILQQREIAKGDAEQEAQLRIAQNTARLQTLSFFARLQIDSMAGATREMQAQMWRVANFYGQRSLAMMRDMGESLDEVKDVIPSGGIVQMMSREGGLSVLTDIANELEVTHPYIRLVNETGFMNFAAPAAIRQAAQRLDRWMKDYAPLFTDRHLGQVNVIPPSMYRVASESVTPSDGQPWLTWCHTVSRFPEQIRQARQAIEAMLQEQS